VPAHRRWPPGRPHRGRDGHLPHQRRPLVGSLPAGRPGRLIDRPSCAHHHPRHTPADQETAVLALRRTRKLGPARIAPLVRLPAATVYRVLCRHGLNRLVVMDRPSGQPVHRYERARPGELVHMDVKKLGRLRDRGGHRVHGRDSDQHRRAPRHGGHRVGYDYIHAVVDDHSRVAMPRCWLMSAVTPAPGRAVLRRPPHRHPAGVDRQRLRLPAQSGTRTGHVSLPLRRFSP